MFNNPAPQAISQNIIASRIPQPIPLLLLPPQQQSSQQQSQQLQQLHGSQHSQQQ